MIFGWLLLVFVLAGLPQLLGWIDLSPVWTDQNSSDVGITLLTVLPYFLYLFLTEISDRHATWGKRRAGITVAGVDGTSPGRGAIAARNVLKVLPWQLGHMGTMRLATSDEVTAAAVTFEVASLLLLAAIVVPILNRRRGVHDALAGTTVTSIGHEETGTNGSPNSL